MTASFLGFLLQREERTGWKLVEEMGETTAHLYADGNDPMEVKLGCGRRV